jgi:hypothetical protein
MDNRPVPNPIPHSSFFVTESIKEVFERIQKDYSGSERTVAIHSAMMILNACHQVVEDEILSKEIFA